MDHLQTIQIFIENTREYNISPYFAFTEFHKAFNSVETWAILRAMDRAKVDSRYSTLLRICTKTLHSA